MKSRMTALGASVIALTLTGGGQALAGGLDDLGQGVKVQTESSVRTPGGVSAELDGNLRVPVKTPSKEDVKGITKAAERSKRPTATVEAKQRSGKDSSTVVLDLNRDGASAYVDQRRKGEFELEAQGEASPSRAESTVTGFSRQAGKVKAHGRGRAPKANHAGLERSIRKHSREGIPNVPHSRGAGEKERTPLQTIGREVGNPIQLSHAGWLVALTAFGGFAAGRLVRRLHRAS